MKAMFLGFTAAILIAIGASVVLDSMQHTIAERYSTAAVRR
ncbi:MAG TPA: hypothetical protein VD978_15100 [Azospirillum sp.]|nr:hypothetical protein [Azospirillum sp.]